MKHISKILSAFAICAGFLAVSCNDQPDAFVPTDGVPEIHFVRYADQDVAITQAYMGEILCLVGDNLRSVHEIWFNDQRSILNTSYMTDHTLIASVPNSVAEVKTDKIYLMTRQNDTIAYDFKVLPPMPVIKSMECEYTKPGDIARIYGNYFIEPMTVDFMGASVSEFTSVTSEYVEFVMPEAEPGKVKVSTEAGTVESKFHYRDTRGLMFEFDGVTGLSNHGWRTQPIENDGTGISGNYLRLGDGTDNGKMTAAGGWNDGSFSFEYWPGDWNTPQTFVNEGRLLTDLVDFSDFTNMSLKFELMIPSANPWSAGTMQLVFAGTDLVTLQTANNMYFRGTGGDNPNPGWPRGLYMPWTTKGAFHTNDKWITVTVPFSEFVYDETGAPATQILDSPDDFTSFLIFVWTAEGGPQGTDCNPILKIDNIRAVPNK